MITENFFRASDFEWIDVQNPDQKDVLRLTDEFGLPHLLALDCLKPEHLPKYEETTLGHFLLMRAFDSESPKDGTTIHQLTRKITLLITDKQIVSIHRVPLPYLKQISERQNPKHKIGKLKILHAIIFESIRSFDVPIERLQNQYEIFEDQVFSSRSRLTTPQMYQFRKRFFSLKRLLKQTQDALIRSHEVWAQDPSLFQDLRENLDEIFFSVEEVSNNFDHLLQLSVAMSDQRANDIMKTLTVFSSVLLPLNFLASFYGMNFSSLPGLKSPHAFYVLCLSMASLGIITLYYFHRRGWFHFRQTHD